MPLQMYIKINPSSLSDPHRHSCANSPISRCGQHCRWICTRSSDVYFIRYDCDDMSSVVLVIVVDFFWMMVCVFVAGLVVYLRQFTICLEATWEARALGQPHESPHACVCMPQCLMWFSVVLVSARKRVNMYNTAIHITTLYFFLLSLSVFTFIFPDHHANMFCGTLWFGCAIATRPRWPLTTTKVQSHPKGLQENAHPTACRGE